MQAAAGQRIGKAFDYKQLQTSFARSASSARDSASVLVESASEVGGRAKRYVGKTVQDQPMLSLIGLAALAYAAAFFIHSPSSPFVEQPPRRRYWI